MATIPIGAQVMKRYSQIILFSDISRQKIKVCACRFETQFILLTGKGCTKGKHKHKQLSGSNVSPSRSGSGDATYPPQLGRCQAMEEARVITVQVLMILVSTRSTGIVPILPILWTSWRGRQRGLAWAACALAAWDVCRVGLGSMGLGQRSDVTWFGRRRLRFLGHVCRLWFQRRKLRMNPLHRC